MVDLRGHPQFHSARYECRPGRIVNPDDLRQRLQGSHSDELVRLVADWVLDRPLEQLIDPQFVAHQVVTALEVSARGVQLEKWVQDQVAAMRNQIPTGQPADQLTPELQQAIETVISRHYTPDQTLVLALIDHPTMENLVEDILSQAMRNFTQKLRIQMPGAPKAAPKARGLGRLGSISQNVLGGLGSEISQRAEQLASQTVDEALRLSVGQVAHHICDPQNADHYSAFRLHLWRTIIAQDNRTLAMEWDKLDPDSLVVAGTAITPSDGPTRRTARRSPTDGSGPHRFSRSDLSEIYWKKQGLHESQDEWRTSLQPTGPSGTRLCRHRCLCRLVGSIAEQRGLRTGS